MAEPKKRHGCLTAWLVLMIIVNSLAALIYLFGRALIYQSVPNLPGWAFPVLFVGLLFNVACAIALLKWKKWGFWGFSASAVLALILNLSFGMGVSSIGGLIGVAILYGVLHIGGENKGWPQLE